eukprot:scaffold70488_cov59-Attheya_sp.AAC.6
MQTKGTKVLFETRVPTKHKLETCEHIEMTLPKPWEPSQVLLQELRADRFTKDIYDENAPFLRQISPCLINLSEVLTKHANHSQVSMVETEIDDVPARRTLVSTERHTKITADSLAERFCIGTERAKQTI